MRHFLFLLTPFTGGLFLLMLILLIEYYAGVSTSVGYVLTVLFILWFSWSNRYVTWVGIFATVLMLTGFFFIDYYADPAIAVNRVLAIVTIWIAIIFVNRFKKLAENEDVQKHQLQALFDNATEGMIFSNSEGEIVRINPAAEKMFGYAPDELLGKKIEVLMPGSYAGRHVVERTRLFENPKARPKGSGRELRGRKKDGKEFDTEISLSFFHDRRQVFYIAFLVDISERKKQEKTIQANVENIKKLNSALDAKVRQRTSELEAALTDLESANEGLTREISERKRIAERLSKSQQLYSAIARNFPEGIIGVLNTDMKYVLADGRELNKIGFSGETPIGRPLFGDENSGLNALAEGKIATVFAGENVSFDVDLGQSAYNVVAVPLPDPSERINEVLVVMKNVTERKTAERKLLMAIDKEKELGALKSRFVTMASHEFRTPLTTMLSSVFLLQNYTPEKYEAQKKNHLDKIKRSIQTLTEIMNDFLSIGSLEEGQIKAVYSAIDVWSFMRETVAEMHSIKKAGQQIELSVPEGQLDIFTDRQMLMNILRNLVSNAVKYSPAQSVIHVSASLHRRDLIIAVADQGMGIPEHEQPEIFKRFYRAENAVNIQGTGLGLNIVKKYVTLLNGQIEFKSMVNEGTTFTLRLPALVEAEKATAE